MKKFRFQVSHRDPKKKFEKFYRFGKIAEKVVWAPPKNGFPQKKFLPCIGEIRLLDEKIEVSGI